MNIESLIEIIVGIAVLISFIYKISCLETKIYLEIDSTEDKLMARLNQIETNFSIHLSSYSAKNEMFEYQIHALNEKTDHKFNRCWNELKKTNP